MYENGEDDFSYSVEYTKGWINMKVKVFKFMVSNPASSMLAGDEKEARFREYMSQLKKPEDIENVINSFCCDKNIISINTNKVDVKYHNNGRGNTIELWYTIVYR